MDLTGLPTAEELAGLGPRELTAAMVELEGLRRRVDVLLAEGVGLVAGSGECRRDGHRSPVAWGRATFNWSTTEAIRMVRVGEVLATMPVLRGAAREGRVGVAQLAEFGRVGANERCADQLPGSDELLTGLATRHWFHEFRVAMLRWEQLADADGAHRAHRDAHVQRHASVALIGSQVVVHAEGGTADGAFLAEVLQRFRDAEFLTDWDIARERLGDAVSVADLDRTDSQRGFDALVAVFRAACAAPVIVDDPEPLVNVIVDAATAEEILRRAAGQDVADPSPGEVLNRRCETLDGTPISHYEMLAMLLVGNLRRVVFDQAGVVIDLGRRARLFRGGARDAVLLSAIRCLWPGCGVRAGRCQTDHTEPWATADGTTSPANGGPACGPHNRHKQRGYIVRRDPTGRWHTYRPDGTEIGEHARAA